MPWFAESDQSLGANARAVELGDLDGDGDLAVLAGWRDWQGGPSCTESHAWLNDAGDFDSGDLATAFQEGLNERPSHAASNAVIAAVDGLFAEEDSIRRKRAFVA
jgi:hypothetical protein